MRSITVYCGSSTGSNPEYIQSARDLGHTLAQAGITLVYGGGGIGMMGALAEACLQSGGQVTGVITRALMQTESAKKDLIDMRVVETMHERKHIMAKLGDAFIALPGGFGTFEELFEAATWLQLDIHRKPVALLNAAGYYTPLLAFLRHSVAEGFIKAPHLEMIQVAENARDLLNKLNSYKHITISKV
jgi:uncharacterized protein (TIGR00730 family)